MGRKELLPTHFKALNKLEDLKVNPIEAIENIMNTYGNDMKILLMMTQCLKIQKIVSAN